MMKSCPVCSEEFLPHRNRHGEQVVCSPCKRKHGIQKCRNIANGVKGLSCAYCGKTIEDGIKNKYCSPQCRNSTSHLKQTKQRAAIEGREYRPRRHGLTKEQIREERILAKRAKRAAAKAAIGRTVNRRLIGDHCAHVLVWKQWLRQLAKPHDAHVRLWKRQATTIAASQRNHYHNSPKMMIYHRVKRWMHKHLGDRLPSRKWSNYLGYTPDDLAAHLERQFLPRMGWHNKGRWHIDHIVPVREFDIKEIGDAEFMACYSLANLRPLWSRDNSRKGGKRVTLL